MSRDVSAQSRRAMFAQHTDQAFLCKLLFSHPNWASVYRFINDRVDREDGAGDTWQAFDFDVTLPDDREDEITLASLKIGNIDRQIVQLIRATATPISVSLWVVRSGDIDDVSLGPLEFSFNHAEWDALYVSGDLEYEPILNIRWPQHDFTPITHPGLFKQ